MHNQVKFKPYDEVYPKIFQKEKERLEEIFKDIDSEIHIEHIGSTAIPGLGGKGIVDIMIALEDFKTKDQVLTKLINSGLFHKETAGSSERIFLSDKPLSSDDVSFHYHIVKKYSEEHIKTIKFRDELRKDKSKVLEYEKLKKELIKLTKTSREYLEGKRKFIEKIL